MKTPNHLPCLGRKRLLSLAVAALAVSAFAIALASPLTRGVAFFVPPANAEPQGGPPANGLKTVIVYATPFGLQPSRFDLPPGAKKLVIRNASNIDNLTFSVSRPGRAEVLSTTAANGQNAVAIVPFVPGETVITEATHDFFRCVITVEE